MRLHATLAIVLAVSGCDCLGMSCFDKTYRSGTTFFGGYVYRLGRTPAVTCGSAVFTCRATLIREENEIGNTSSIEHHVASMANWYGLPESEIARNLSKEGKKYFLFQVVAELGTNACNPTTMRVEGGAAHAAFPGLQGARSSSLLDGAIRVSRPPRVEGSPTAQGGTFRALLSRPDMEMISNGAAVRLEFERCRNGGDEQLDEIMIDFPPNTAADLLEGRGYETIY